MRFVGRGDVEEDLLGAEREDILSSERAGCYDAGRILEVIRRDDFIDGGTTGETSTQKLMPPRIGTPRQVVFHVQS